MHLVFLYEHKLKHKMIQLFKIMQMNDHVSFGRRHEKNREFAHINIKWDGRRDSKISRGDLSPSIPPVFEAVIPILFQVADH
jgi:hypothetical protein